MDIQAAEAKLATRRCRAGSGRAATALVGVVESIAIKLDARCRENLVGQGVAIWTKDIWVFAHLVLNLKLATTLRAAVIIMCHK